MLWNTETSVAAKMQIMNEKGLRTNSSGLHVRKVRTKFLTKARCNIRTLHLRMMAHFKLSAWKSLLD
jgi:hypothetical protein